MAQKIIIIMFPGNCLRLEDTKELGQLIALLHPLDQKKDISGQTGIRPIN